MVKTGDIRNIQPDPWIASHLPRVRAGGTILDLAAGKGRHSRLALETGYQVVAVDRDCVGLSDLSGSANVEIVEADLEMGPWPLEARRFDGIIVCNYLWRPLFPAVRSALAPGGVLIWTTFAAGNEAFGRPKNPDFLLRRNELIEAFAPLLEVIAYFDDRVEQPGPAVRQGIVARRPDMDRRGDGC